MTNITLISSRRCIALALLGLLTGCTSMAPQYKRPPLAVAASYPAAGNAAAASNASAASTMPADWQHYFSDPALQSYITQALEHNRDLRTATLRVEQARAALGYQQAALAPVIAAQGGSNRTHVPADLSLTRHPMITSQFQAGVGLAAWELDFWGRLASLRDAARADFLATDAARQAVTLGLIAQVADAYYALREADQRLLLAQRTLASRQESFRIYSRRVAAGSASRLNLTQVETLLTQAQALAAQLEQQRDAALQALQLLAGQPIQWQAVTSADSALGELPELAAGLPAALLERRPDVRAAELQLQAAYANIGAARAAYFPSISLTASGGTASAALDGLFKPGSGSWNFSPSITLPLFDGGRRDANLALMQARRDSAVASYDKAVQAAFRDVANALSARHWLGQQVGIASHALAVQRERARLTQLRFDNGAAPYLDVLDAQRDLLSAEQQLVQTRRALLSAGIAVYAALGGAPQAAPQPELLPTPRS
ncbi:efflux transporter outer membrane subunit [Pseudoduganella danionis]|uniref:Efflux transporter outer membrane subunit n=1 Tax=Pseudoduganella danionis TaxID=1890295 RepID=A0ABW9SK57_9BURK|nr:efflux transporter outer membrane subunit [Pseudoduganella danionis]MTW32546.1 efflux transporter outer membrane subunit [Pseudoduganella danionis]